MSRKQKKIIREIWGKLHMVSELKVTTLGPEGKEKLF